MLSMGEKQNIRELVLGEHRTKVDLDNAIHYFLQSYIYKTEELEDEIDFALEHNRALFINAWEVAHDNMKEVERFIKYLLTSQGEIEIDFDNSPLFPEILLREEDILIGSISCFPRETSDLSLECQNDLAALGPVYPFVTNESFLTVARQNRGLGRKMYMELAKQLRINFNGVLFSHACVAFGDTKETALRVYNSLQQKPPAGFMATSRMIFYTG